MKYSKLFMKLQIPNLRKHQIFFADRFEPKFHMSDIGKPSLEVTC